MPSYETEVKRFKKKLDEEEEVELRNTGNSYSILKPLSFITQKGGSKYMFLLAATGS